MNVYEHPEYAAAYRDYRRQGLDDITADRLAASYVALVTMPGPLSRGWRALRRKLLTSS